jgi:hypothetical protein
MTRPLGAGHFQWLAPELAPELAPVRVPVRVPALKLTQESEPQQHYQILRETIVFIFIIYVLVSDNCIY